VKAESTWSAMRPEMGLMKNGTGGWRSLENTSLISIGGIIEPSA